MVASITAIMTSVQGDGGNLGKAVTTPASGIVANDYLLVCELGAANADAMTPPAGWSTIALPDTSIATGGGAIQAWFLKDPAPSTTYSWTSSSGRASIIGLLVNGADATTLINIASSLESAFGTNHAPPAITTTVPNCLIVGFAGMRCFAPDVSNWTVPASWTEIADIQGADGNNNCRLAAGTFTQVSAGAVPTTVWTNTDANEEAIIIYVAIQPAAGGGTNVTAADTPSGYRWQSAVQSGITASVTVSDPPLGWRWQSTGGVAAPGVVASDAARLGYRWTSSSGPGVTINTGVQDVPGGWRLGQSGAQATLGVISADQPGTGYRLGASPATGTVATLAPDTGPLGLRWRSTDGAGVVSSLVIADVATGFRWGSADGSGVILGVVVADAAAGLRWVSADGAGVAFGLTIADSPAGLRWRSADGLGATWGVTTPDSPSGWRLGVSVASASVAVVVPDTPDGLRWRSGASGITVNVTGDVLVVDLSPGWLRLGESRASVTLGGLADIIAIVRMDRFTGQAVVDHLVARVDIDHLLGVVSEDRFGVVVAW